MKKYISCFLLLTLIFITLISFLFKDTSNTLYGKVSIVESKEEALKSLNTSIPKQIIIKTNFYRDTIITNKLEIDNILDLINSIKKSSSKENEVLESNNSASNISGKIIYNNKSDVFSLNNNLILNNTTYNGDSYLINTLHKKLMNYFNTYTHLIDILNNKDSSIFYINGDTSFYLNDFQKKELVHSLSKLKVMNDESKLINTKISDSKLYTLKININKSIKNRTNNLVFIDVYPSYVIIQFLADDNGKKIYLKGVIDEI